MYEEFDTYDDIDVHDLLDDFDPYIDDEARLLELVALSLCDGDLVLLDEHDTVCVFRSCEFWEECPVADR